MRDAARPPRAWRVLRRLLPAWYAQRYADDVWQTHLDARHAHASSVRFWMRLLGDVVVTSLQLRVDAVFGRRALSPERRPRAGAEIMMQQAVHVLRGLRRAPGFVAAVVLTLGLGIGATITLFMVLDRLFFSPPEHVVDAGEVHRIYVYGRNTFTYEVQYSAALTYPDYRDFEQVAAFRDVAAFAQRELAADVAGATSRVHVELASASYFPLLGVRPHIGRFYTEAEDRIEGGTPAAVLGYGYWQREFGGDPSVLGRALPLGKGVYTVVGVAPRGFTGVDIAPVDVWVPLLTAGALESGTEWRDARRWWWLRGVARLDPARVDAAAAEATALHRAGRADVPRQDPDARIVLSPLIEARGPIPTRESQVARLLGGLALLVLLIACANVANLMLARGVQRRRLLAIQTAIGLTRSRLIGQILLESLVLAVVAGGIALAFTHWIAPVLFRVLMPDAALRTGAALRLVAFTLSVALVVTALIGVVPALRSTRFDVIEALRTARESRRGSTIRRALLFVQASLSAILVIGAGLFLRSLERARAVDLGVDISAVAVEFELQDGTRWGEQLNDVSYAALERIRALPFVSSAAVTQLAQFQGLNGLTMLVDGDTVSISARGPFFHTGTSGYFDAIGLHVRRGRGLEDADDRAGAEPVIVISQSVADVAFRDRDPLGACVLVEPKRDTLPPCTRVVGVVEDMLPSIRADAPNLNVYLPPHHPGMGFTGAGVIMLRVSGDWRMHREAIRSAAAAASPRIRIVEVNALANFLDEELRPWRLGAVLLTAFGVLALVVAAGGLYSVLAFDVAQRRFELGVRAALGASRRRLIRAVALRALIICGAGALAGGLATILLGDVVDALLFQVSAFEPAVYLAAFAMLAIVAVLAAALPAWRAVRVDPRVALRSD